MGRLALNPREPATNPYRHLVSEYARFATEGRHYPLGGFSSVGQQPTAENSPKVLLFSPHPDDECVVGGLALRLLREAKMNVINVAITQGSNRARQAERLEELQNACRFLGFGLVQTAPNGLEKVNPSTRQREPKVWEAMVQVVVDMVAAHKPKVLFFPHEHDWNSTHVGVHWLAMDALERLGSRLNCYTVETEFWGQMDDPNLAVESCIEDVTDLVTATSFHAGEVRRNPYHLLLPAWMQDNVRRGGELVGGQGGAAPEFIFATLYRLRRWHGGHIERFYQAGMNLPASTNAASLFA